MEKPLPTIDIVISDDHGIVREGLRLLLEAEPQFRVVGEAADGEETVTIVRQLNPEILLLDLSLPKLSGLEALREINKTADLRTRTVILTAAIEREQVVEALQLGAHGVVLKTASPDVLVKSIQRVTQNEYWIGHEGVADLVHALRRLTPTYSGAPANRNFGVTTREMQVLELIVAGYTNKDIAQKLGISEHTTKHHLTNIFDKLGVANRLELVLFAIAHGLVKSD